MKRIEASAARRQGFVSDVDPANQLPRISGIADMDHVGIGAKSREIAAGVHQAAADPAFLQHLDGAVHCEALGKTAEVDLHPGSR